LKRPTSLNRKDSRMLGPSAVSRSARIASETASAAMSPPSMRSVQRRLEKLLVEDRELLISLQCQLEQIRRQLRLPTTSASDAPSTAASQSAADRPVRD
jgi:hypothetical protein